MVNQIMKQTLLTIILLSGFTILAAQTFTSSYSCDFEDETQNASWALMNGQMASSMDNNWYIGAAANNGGANGLYISADNGHTAYYTNSTGLVVAVVDVYLKAGEYDLSFDWCANGNVDRGEGLYVCWAPDRHPITNDTIRFNNANTTNTRTADMQTYKVDFSMLNQSNNTTSAVTTDVLNGSATWKTAVGKVQSDGTHRRLVFVWTVDGNADGAANPGACIDNISIVDSRMCPRPTDLNVTEQANQQVVFSWSGTSDEYEVKTYSYMEKSWQILTVRDTFCIFTGLAEGTHDFYVSSVCDEGLKSITSAYSDFFLYFPENHCIDYLTFDSTNCFVANENVSSSQPVSSLTWTNKMVDYGYRSQASRHTKHTSPVETDPRTCGQLKTVPDGEIASIRLGNWAVGAQAERMEFKFAVNADINPVLLLKYAVVLQKPGGGCTPNPGFLLRVLNKNGQLVSKCASADFDFKAAAEAEWNVCYPSLSEEIRWKDWTTVGVNLEEYNGDTLTIQLITYDCGAGGHYGYAYFTLSCSDGKLSGISCNAINTQFIAPEGFLYRWHKAGEAQCWDNVLSREQIFEVAETDTCHYEVDMMFPQDTTCYFSLTASAQPFAPSASAGWKQQPHDCLNEVQFTDLSHVKETNQLTGEVLHTARPVDRVVWDFGDGTVSYERNPVHIFPNEGGRLNVKLTAYLSTCEETYIITDSLPAIGDKYDTLYVQQCFGTEYHYTYSDESGILKTDTLTLTGEYDYTFKTSIGCDSLFTILLDMVDTVRVFIDTLIMRGETYYLGQTAYTETGTYVVHDISAAGCDSVTTLDLKVYDFPIVEADTMYYLCAGDNLLTFNYRFKQGLVGNYSLYFQHPDLLSVENEKLYSETSLNISLPADIEPDIYKATMVFLDTMGMDVVVDFTFEVRYNAEVLTQRWNDVLAVRNSAYNGGYDFVAFQWYKNGTPVDGAVGDWYYEPEGLDLTAEYSALLIRADGKQLMTCSFIPQHETYNDIPVISTLTKRAQPLYVRPSESFSWSGIAYWLNPQGMVVLTQKVVEGAGLIAPDHPGVYLLNFVTAEGDNSVYRIVVRP